MEETRKEIWKITDSRNNHRLGNKQKASKKWIENNLDEEDLRRLDNGEQIGVTVKKGKGYSHVTLIKE